MTPRQGQQVSPAGTYDSPRVVDGNRLDRGRRRIGAAFAALVLGVVVGGLIGALYGSSRPVTHEATSSLAVVPDSAVDPTSGDNIPDQDATSFIQAQLVTLNGDQLARTVRRQLRLTSKPEFGATQIGQSYSVRLTVSAASAARATAVVTRFATDYQALRTDSLDSQLATAVRATDKQIADVRDELALARRGRSVNSGATPAEVALQNENERLLSLRSGLLLTQSQTGQLVSVLSPAAATAPGLSAEAEYGLAGALIGAVVGTAVSLGADRVRSRIRSIADVSALDLPVLLPTVRRRSRLQRRHGPAAGPERVLAGRIAGAAAAARRPMIFVGPTARIGTTFVASSVAAAMAELGPVLLVRAGNPAAASTAVATIGTGSPAAAASHVLGEVRAGPYRGVWTLPILDGGTLEDQVSAELLRQAADRGWLVVVDAASLTESSQLVLRGARADALVVLVVGRGRTKPVDALSAAELIESRQAELLGVVLNDVPIGGVSRCRDWARSVRRSRSGLDQSLTDVPADPPAYRRPQPGPTQSASPISAEAATSGRNDGVNGHVAGTADTDTDDDAKDPDNPDVIDHDVDLAAAHAPDGRHAAGLLQLAGRARGLRR